MSKRVAVLAVNPVNGFGLFQYLEAFYENKIEYKVYAVSDTVDIRTNSGIAIKTDDTIAHLKGHSDDFDALANTFYPSNAIESVSDADIEDDFS